MFGPKLTKVFKSRWHALFWAGSVMLTAYCTVPAAKQESDGEQVAEMVTAVQHRDKPAHHINPWAKD